VLSYTIPKIKLVCDLSSNWKGPMYLPLVPNDFRPEKSPWFALVNLQLSRKFKNQLEIYGGAKNLLNFIPKNPILRPEDPFDKKVGENNPNGFTFDPSYNYAPVQGIKVFLGVSWSFN
jgi:outer membrane receptor for ferrienterochelin and colicins